MKKILILANFDDFYNTRKEVVAELLKEYEVNICYPYGPNIEKFKKMGCLFTNIEIDRRGTNPWHDLILNLNYRKILKKYKPDVVLTYSIKPNIYGGFWCRLLKIPYLVNITGLGTALENPGILQKVTILMHKVALKKVNTIFVQNQENKNFFIKHHIHSDKLHLIPGSGVNTDEFCYLEYPDSKDLHFLFVARVMKEKGIDQYLDTAKYIKVKYPNTYFHILGFCEENYKDILKSLENKEIIKYHGLVQNVSDFYRMSCCIIHPSYYPEGMSNILLEACSSGRPVITTNRSGCKEVVEDGVTGYVVNVKDSSSLIKKVEEFILLNNESKKNMGLLAREKVMKSFNRNLIISTYKKKVNELL